MFSSPHTPVMGAGLGFQAQRLNLWANWVSALPFFGGGEPDAQPTGGCSSPLAPSQKPFPANPLSSPPQKESPLAWWKKSLDIIFGLGTASAVPSQCPRPNNNPF